MPPTSAQRNKWNKTWIAKNKDKFRENCKINQRRYDAWQRAKKLYCSILLD